MIGSDCGHAGATDDGCDDVGGDGIGGDSGTVV